MKKQLLSAVMLCTLGVVGCGEDTTGPTTDTGPKYNTADKVRTYLEGKTMVMEGNNIPTDPNGINENVLADPITQCYNKVTMRMAAGQLTVSSVRAVVENPQGQFNIGDCNRDNVRDTVEFTSTNVNIENARPDGTCFDITATYVGFAQEGRAKIAQDGKTMELELYFQGFATGHRCADGDVGAKTVKQRGVAFAGNAVQTYVIQ
jgi:hypothetical protein